jgi:hypothetical protein
MYQGQLQEYTRNFYLRGAYTVASYLRACTVAASTCGEYLHSQSTYTPDRTTTHSYTRSRIHHRRRSTSYETRSESSGFTTGGAKHRSKWIPAVAEWLRLQSSCNYIPSYTHDDELSAVKTSAGRAGSSVKTIAVRLANAVKTFTKNPR